MTGRHYNKATNFRKQCAAALRLCYAHTKQLKVRKLLALSQLLNKPRFRDKQLPRPQAIPPTAPSSQDLSRIQLLSAMNRSSVALEIIKQRPRLITDIGNLCENESKSFCKLFFSPLMQSTRRSWMKYIIGFCRSRSPLRYLNKKVNRSANEMLFCLAFCEVSSALAA